MDFDYILFYLLTPTVKPTESFEACADAKKLARIFSKPMPCFRTKAIIKVLAHRTNSERLEISVQFKNLYGKDLINVLKSKLLSGHFKKLIVIMMTPLPQFSAKELHDALNENINTNVFLEMLSLMGTGNLKTIIDTYKQKYNSNNLKLILKWLLKSSFNDENLKTTMQTIPMFWSESTNFERIMKICTIILQSIFHSPDESLFDGFIENLVNGKISKEAENTLSFVVFSGKTPSKFLAECLYKSMKGKGTINDRDLIRLVVTRCETDMGEIKRFYKVNYGESLADCIERCTSGGYKKCLLALIGESIGEKKHLVEIKNTLKKLFN